MHPSVQHAREVALWTNVAKRLGPRWLTFRKMCDSSDRDRCTYRAFLSRCSGSVVDIKESLSSLTADEKMDDASATVLILTKPPNHGSESVEIEIRERIGLRLRVGFANGDTREVDLTNYLAKTIGVNADIIRNDVRMGCK